MNSKHGIARVRPSDSEDDAAGTLFWMELRSFIKTKNKFVRSRDMHVYHPGKKKVKLTHEVFGNILDAM